MKPRFVELAKRAARYSEHQFRVGAVVVHKNRLVSFGHNQPLKSHPRSRNRWGRIHAELHAILGVPLEVLRGTSLYVVRLTRVGLLATSHPCLECMALIREVGIKRIYFVNDKRIVEEENVQSINNQ